MKRPKLRRIFQFIIILLIVSYLGLLLFTDIPNVNWSIGLLLIVTVLHILKGIFAPKYFNDNSN